MIPLKWFTKGSLVNLNNPNSLYSTFFAIHVFLSFCLWFSIKIIPTVGILDCQGSTTLRLLPLVKGCKISDPKSLLEIHWVKKRECPDSPNLQVFSRRRKPSNVPLSTSYLLRPEAQSWRIFGLLRFFLFGCKLGNRKQSWNKGRTRTAWSQVVVDFSFFVVVGEVGLGFPKILQICWIPTFVDYPRLKDLKPMLPCSS